MSRIGCPVWYPRDRSTVGPVQNRGPTEGQQGTTRMRKQPDDHDETEEAWLDRIEREFDEGLKLGRLPQMPEEREQALAFARAEASRRRARRRTVRRARWHGLPVPEAPTRRRAVPYYWVAGSGPADSGCT